MKRQNKRSLEVLITDFTKKGHGIGMSVGENPSLVEVPFSIPGDQVKAQIQSKRRGVYSSRLEEIVVSSPLRIAARCIHFASCGGCRWQQMAYQEQLRIKQQHIETLFYPLSDSKMILNQILDCDPYWRYRNKMEFSFSSDAAGQSYLGLIIDGSRGKVLNLTECHLVNPWFVEAIAAVNDWWKESELKAYHPHLNTGSLRTLIVREGIRTGDRLVMLTVSGNTEYALNRRQLDQFVASLRIVIEPYDPLSKLSVFLRIQQAVKGTETAFYEILLYGPDHINEVLEVKVKPDAPAQRLNCIVSPSAFFQPNTKQAERLYSMALQLLEVCPEDVVYDLYCGTGTIGLCIAKYVKQVIGIELSEESCLDARTNAQKNSVDNMQIITGSVKDALAAIRNNKSFPLPDIVIVDPPRIGLDKETLQHLRELLPSKILYISCNPTTQAENAKELKEMGYELVFIQPVDQFPHTVHIENIVVFKLKSV